MEAAAAAAAAAEAEAEAEAEAVRASQSNAAACASPSCGSSMGWCRYAVSGGEWRRVAVMVPPRGHTIP